MSYATVAKACRENLGMIGANPKDTTHAVLYNISVALQNLSLAVQTDLGELEKRVAHVERIVKQLRNQ